MGGAFTAHAHIDRRASSLKPELQALHSIHERLIEQSLLAAKPKGKQFY